MIYQYSLYELTMQLTFPCPALTAAPADAVADVQMIEGDVPRELPGAVVEGENYQAAPGRFLLRGGLRAGRFLVENGRTITLQRNAAVEESRLAAHFLSSVLAATLRQRGLIVLHANAAVTPCGAVVISGESGAGKSTTLAALLARGCSMLADDITVLRMGKDNIVKVVPGLSKLNLCEDAAYRLGHNVEELPRNLLRRIKVVVPAKNRLVTKPAPLDSIYLLKKSANKALHVTMLNGADKFAAVQECIYGPLFQEEHSSRFDMLAAIANQATIYRLERPASHWSVDEIAGVICHD